MSDNLKSTICSYKANNSYATNPSQLDEEGRGSYKSTTEISGNNDFQIRSYLQEMENINKLVRNLSTIKKCFENFGEYVEHLNFSELECAKYFNNETTKVNDFLDAATNIETDKRECASLLNKIIDDVNSNSSDPDFKDSVTISQSNSRKNDMLTKKEKPRKRGKHKNNIQGNKNTSNLYADKSKPENGEERVDTPNDLLHDNIKQLSYNRGIELKTKTEKCEISLLDIKERRQLLIKEYTKNMNDMVTHTRELSKVIVVENRKFCQLMETLGAYDMTLYFACREQGRKRHTESEWRKLYALQEQQYKVENERIFKGISENPIVNPEKNSDDNSENIKNVFLENLSEKKNLQINNKLVSIDKKSLHDDFEESGVAVKIQSEVVIENQSDNTFNTYSIGTAHEKQLNVTLKILSDNFDKENSSEILTLIAEDNFHNNKFNVNLECNYVSDQETQSNDAITISHEFDKKNPSKIVGKIHVNNENVYKPESATEFNPNQENQSDVTEVNSKNTDLGSLSQILAVNNHILRACIFKIMYEEQESLMNSLRVIPENMENSDLKVAFGEFNGICEDSCNELLRILLYIFEQCNLVLNSFRNLMEYWKAKTNKNIQKFKEPNQQYIKFLNEAEEYYEGLMSALTIAKEGSGYLLNMTANTKQLSLQNSYSLISNGIFLHQQYYTIAATVGIIMERFLHYEDFYMKFEELLIPHLESVTP